MLGRLAALLLAAALSACADKAAEEAVKATLSDPASARFQAVSDRGDHVCGEVNFAGENGRYGGYARFVYDKGAGLALVDPRLGALEVSLPASACAKPFAYQSVEERLSCANRPQAASAAGRQRGFEALWRRACS